jgi:integrase
LDLEFVLHSLRHTALTRLVDSGTDSFTLKLIAGHDSVVTSERYIHKSPQAAKAAIARRYRADGVGTWRKPVKAKALQTAVNKQAGA